MVGRFEYIARSRLADDAKLACHSPTLVDLPFQVEVVGDGRVGGVVYRVESSIVERIVVVAHLTSVVGVGVCLDQVALVIIDAAIRVHSVVVGEGTVWGIVATVVVDGEFVADDDVLQAISQGDTSRESVAVAAFHRSLDIVIREVDTILQTMLTAFEIEGVLVAYSCVDRLSEPVGINATQYISKFVGVCLVEGNLGDGIVAAVESCHLLHL